MKKFAKTWWSMDDVYRLYEDVFGEACPWSDERCYAFLKKHEDDIFDAMSQAGWSVLENHMYEEVS